VVPSKGGLLALPTHVRLGLKGTPGTNILAHFGCQRQRIKVLIIDTKYQCFKTVFFISGIREPGI
jgi:hypothetical protein